MFSMINRERALEFWVSGIFFYYSMINNFEVRSIFSAKKNNISDYILLLMFFLFAIAALWLKYDRSLHDFKQRKFLAYVLDSLFLCFGIYKIIGVQS